jgi:ABC-2 type transport system permease protein
MSALSGHTTGVRFDIDDVKIDGQALASGEQKAKLFGLFIAVLGVPVLITMIIVVFFYIADCLYSERKDRSILFWKSMPVSDAATVWSKVVTALGVTPLITWVIGLVTVTLGFLIVKARLSGTPFEHFATWDTGIWLKVQGIALGNMLIASFWYAPIVGYMLAVSAWARRSVLMWIILPPVFLTWMEEVLLDTNHVAQFIGRRFAGFFEYLGTDAARLPRGTANGAQRADQIAARFDSISAAELLASAELWLGVVAAIALIYVAIRMRRYRDDT